MCSAYIGASPVPQATQHRQAFTATASQTSFATVGYTPQFIDVYLNGVKLAAADYTATNGSDIVLTTGAAASDILEIVAYTPFEVASQTFTGTTTVDVLDVTGAATGTDLTLSGGVYLGGTGAANKLDDYEEGTFTPVLLAASVDPSVTYSTQYGSYTKIGNTVNVLVDVRWSAQSGGSGVAILSGLPFSSVAHYSYCAIGEKSASWNYSTYTQYTASIINNNQARVLVSANGLGSAEFPITSLGTGAGYILFSLTYITNA